MALNLRCLSSLKRLLIQLFISLIRILRGKEARMKTSMTVCVSSFQRALISELFPMSSLIKSLISSTLVLAFVSTSFLLIVFFVALDLTICRVPYIMLRHIYANDIHTISCLFSGKGKGRMISAPTFAPFLFIEKILFIQNSQTLIIKAFCLYCNCIYHIIPEDCFQLTFHLL